ncbi:MAG TPA: hypothetical protein EYH23_01240 [Euryarchaeota archaeon]|nr:hypothetical protein [Euryarchaeota archaeon]
MERNKTLGLVVALFIAMSSAAVLVYAPFRPQLLPPGDYSGFGFGRVVEFVDKRWMLVSPADTNGLKVVNANGPYVYIEPLDVNATAEILDSRGIVWYRDAVLEINADVGGKTTTLRAYGHVFPHRSVGSFVPVEYFLTVNPDGTYFAYAVEVIR